MGANLTGANFKGTNLMATNLMGTILQWANFKDADLTGANLKGADLTDIKNLTCEQLKGAFNWLLAFRDKSLACGGDIPVKTAI